MTEAPQPIDAPRRLDALSPGGRALTLGLPLVALAGLGLWWLAGRQYLLIDDSYIAFRYAANFADGRGLVWNVGEHVEGYTNLLWVLFLSVFARLGADLTVPSVVADLVFAGGTVVLLERISRLTRPEAGTLAHLLPVLLLASHPSFAHAATSGMESTAFGFLVLLSLYYLLRGRDEPKLRRLAALAFSAAYLTRPEGAFVCAVALATECALLTGSLKSRLRALLPIAGSVALAVVLHVAIRRAYYGYFLPNTFYAKVIFGRGTILRGTAHVAGFLLASGFLALPGVLETEREGRLRPWTVHGYALLVAYAAYLILVGGDHPFWYRFYAPLLPLPLLATSERLRRAGLALTPALGRAPRTGLSVLAIGVVTGWGVGAGFVFGELSDALGKLNVTGKNAVLYTLEFFRREVPSGSLVAAEAVGYLGYYDRDLRILDMWGLNDAHIAHIDAVPAVKFGHDKTDPAYVLAAKPDYAYLLAVAPAVASLPGYDLCWPSAYYPFAVYRRNFRLLPKERALAVPDGVTRRLEPPPSCRPPGPRTLALTPPPPIR